MCVCVCMSGCSLLHWYNRNVAYESCVFVTPWAEQALNAGVILKL